MKWRKPKPKAKQPTSAKPLTPWEKAQMEQKKAVDNDFWRNLEANNLPQTKRLRRKFTPTKGRRRMRHTTGRQMALPLRMIIYGCLAVLAIIIWYVSPLNQIEQVKITGATSAVRSEVKQVVQAKFHRKSRLVRAWLQANAMQRQVKRQVNQLKSVTVNFHGRTLVIKLHQYRTVAQLRYRGNYYAVSANGAVASHKAKQISGNVPLIMQLSPKSSKVKQIARQLRQLQASVLTDINEITPQKVSYDPQRLRLAMNDGTIVYVRLQTFAAKMKYYPSIRKQMKKKGIVNLEVGAYSYY